MVEVRELGNGRFEVYAEDLHHEVFEGRLGAQLVAEALAAQLSAETGHPVEIFAPWGQRFVGG